MVNPVKYQVYFNSPNKRCKFALHPSIMGWILMEQSPWSTATINQRSWSSKVSGFVSHSPMLVVHWVKYEGDISMCKVWHICTGVGKKILHNIIAIFPWIIRYYCISFFNALLYLIWMVLFSPFNKYIFLIGKLGQ